MISQSNNFKHTCFVHTYEQLHSKFKNNENARALLNEVATQVLSAFHRKSHFETCEDAVRYFLWLLSKKGLNNGSSFTRDVDVPQHQSGYRRAVHLSLDDTAFEVEKRLMIDPRKGIVDELMFDQLISSLNEAEKELLVHRIKRGRTLEEIGEDLNLTPQGVKKRLDKIYSRLRHRFFRAG